MQRSRYSFRRLCSRNTKRFHTETIHLLCVLQNRTSNIAIPYKSTNARQREIKPSRFRQLRREQTKLHLAGTSWLCLESDCENRCLWWIGFQFEMKQFEPELIVSCRHRRTDSAGVDRAALKG